MVRKIFPSAVIILIILFSCVFAQAGKTTVGGHFKLTLFDYSTGERTFTDSINTTQKADGARRAGMSVTRFTLLMMQEIKEIFSIVVQPNFDATTGATPRIGKSIGEKLTASAPKFVGFQKAFMRILIPYPFLVEVSGGVLFPRFTMDYGAELFFEDEYNGSKFAISSSLGEMSGTGIELYRTFELGFASLPTYVYIMNGSGNLFHDNNDSPEGMIHIEPEIGPVRLFGSFLGGIHSDEGRKTVFRWSGGCSVTMGPVELRSEYAGGQWEETVSDSIPSDAEPHGFYAKLFYQFTSWGKIMAHYNYSRFNYIGTAENGIPGKEIYSTVTPGFNFNFFDCLAVQFQCDIGNWRRKNSVNNTRDSLVFYRYFMGLRATF